MREATLRAPSLADVDAAVAVINRESQWLRGRDDVSGLAVHGWWTQPPPCDLTADALLAEVGGEVVGYGDLFDQGHDGSVLWLDVRGERREEMLAELERRAIARLAADGVLRAVADERDNRYREVLRDRGYLPVRASFRMGIDLGGRRFEPVWPQGASVRCAAAGTDEPVLHSVLQQAFADHWGFVPQPYPEWLHWLREIAMPDPAFWFLVEVETEVAAAAICRPEEYGDPDCGWVSELGVLPRFRRRGIASALLAHSFAAFQARGLARAGLGVDAGNTTGAVRLYERAGMHVVERRDTWERRP